jgi:protein-arginine kinase activator protein McsA
MTDDEINKLSDLIAKKIINILFEQSQVEVRSMPSATEEELMLAEVARLMTLMHSYEEKEEYEKAAVIMRKIERIQNKLK